MLCLLLFSMGFSFSELNRSVKMHGIPSCAAVRDTAGGNLAAGLTAAAPQAECGRQWATYPHKQNR